MKLTTHELDWLAFRYIAGELPANELADFESLLADDQSARDAVVRAVELSQTILAAQTTLADESAKVGILSTSAAAVSWNWSARHWSTHLSWLASGVAALLLVVLAMNFGSQSEPQLEVRSPVSPELAQAWLRQTESDEASDDNASSEGSEFVTAVPDWMVDAVRSLHDRSSDGNDAANDEDASSETMET